VRDKNHRRPVSRLKNSRRIGVSVCENNFLLAGYTLSFLLLSNDSPVVSWREREKRGQKTRVCKSPRAISCDFRESYLCDSLPRREVNVYIRMRARPVPTAEYDYKYGSSYGNVLPVEKRQLSMASLLIQQSSRYSRLLLNRIILHRAQQFFSSSSVSSFLTKMLPFFITNVNIKSQ